MRRCTHCDMEIQPDVTICPYCFRTVRATRLCSHCGTPIKPGARTCSLCTAPLPIGRIPDDPIAALIASAKDPIAERERHPIISNPYMIIYLLVMLVIIATLVWQIYDDQGPGQQRMQMEGMLRNTAGNVSGTGDTLKESETAAVTAWNSLNGVGIPVRIRFGSLQGPVSDLTATDRAWVMAEVKPGCWIAGDPVKGCCMQATDNSLYYRGWDYPSVASAQDTMARITRYRTLNTAVAAGTATTDEWDEWSMLTSSLTWESRNLIIEV